MKSTEQKRSLFLLLASAGLTPIALSYGLAPQSSLPWLFDIDASGTNTRHIFRAIMGLYLALVVFWLVGARKAEFRIPALYSLVVFMVGLALGRLASLLVDGIPHFLLVMYMLVEFVFGFVGWRLIQAR